MTKHYLTKNVGVIHFVPTFPVSGIELVASDRCKHATSPNLHRLMTAESHLIRPKSHADSTTSRIPLAVLPVTLDSRRR